MNQSHMTERKSGLRKPSHFAKVTYAYSSNYSGGTATDFHRTSLLSLGKVSKAPISYPMKLSNLRLSCMTRVVKLFVHRMLPLQYLKHQLRIYFSVLFGDAHTR